jgi:hypothetical protein
MWKRIWNKTVVPCWLRDIGLSYSAGQRVQLEVSVLHGWPTRPASRAALQEASQPERAMYQTLKLIKSKYRSGLTDEHLTELVRTAVTTYQPKFKKLAAYPEL